MASARYTVEVERQLVEITQYIARDNLVAALNGLEQMRTACERQAVQPDLGELVRTGRFGSVRRHVVGVVHGARDPEAFR